MAVTDTVDRTDTPQSGPLDPTPLAVLVDTWFEAGIELPPELANITFEDLELTAEPKGKAFRVTGRTSSSWRLPLGVAGVHVEGLALTIARTAADGISGSIEGAVRLGANTFTAVYTFPGDVVLSGRLPSVNLSAVVQELCGADTVRSVPAPAVLMATELTDAEFELSPRDGRISLEATTVLGRIALAVSKEVAGGWGFSVGFLLSGRRAFATISPALAVLDDIGLTECGIVVSTLQSGQLALPGGGRARDVSWGVNLHAVLDLRGLGADEILGLRDVAVSAAIGNRPEDLALEAQVAGDVPLGTGVVLSEVTLRLKPAPADFSLALLGVVRAAVGDAELSFTGGLEVEPRSAVFQGTMEGRWAEPFGFRGVSLAQMAVELGVSFPPPVPSVGIAGSLEIGDFVGAAAVKFDSAMPTRSMVAVAFNRLYLMDVLRAFCDPRVVHAIPSELQNTVLDVGFEDVNVYIVPQPTSIGGLEFDRGFTIKGRMNLWGFRAAAEVTIDYGSGIYIAAACDPIELGGVFKLQAAVGPGGPSLMLDLRTGRTALVDVQGRIELLGLSAETTLRISDQGFSFTVSGRIFDLFEATIVARGDDLAKGDNFYVAVAMRSDLLAYLRDQATRAITDVANAATRDLRKAQDDLARAQADVARVDVQIRSMRAIVEDERRRNQQALTSATKAVADAQTKVDGIRKQITDMRLVIAKEREQDAKRLSATQADLRNAQDSVNSLQSQINAAHSRIATLRSEIQSWQNWYNRLAWYDKAWGWTRLGAETGWRNVEIGAQYTAIGALEASKVTANAALELAKKSAALLAAAAKTFPVEADPRMVGLAGTLATATGALNVANATLRAARDLIKAFPVDADPRVAALIATRATGSAAVSAAQAVLQGVEVSVGGLAGVGTFIAEGALGGLLDVRAASFEGQLSAATSGSVVLSVELVFMGQAQSLRLGFNFYNPIAAVGDLVTRLLPR